MRHIILLLSIFSGACFAQTPVKVKMFPGAPALRAEVEGSWGAKVPRRLK